MSKKGTGKFIVGGVLGAGLALLFAPKKGEELRGDLKNKIDDLINKAKETDVEEVKENIIFGIKRSRKYFIVYLFGLRLTLKNKHG